MRERPHAARTPRRRLQSRPQNPRSARETMTYELILCPEEDCRTKGRRTRLARLAERGDRTWIPFEDAKSGAKIYRCPSHGHFLQFPGRADLIKPKGKA